MNQNNDNNNNQDNLCSKYFKMWLSLAFSKLNIYLSRFFMAFLLFLFLCGPKKTAFLPNGSAANVEQPRLVASMDIPTLEPKNTILDKKKGIPIKEQSHGVKIELFDDLQNHTSSSNLQNRSVIKNRRDRFNKRVLNTLSVAKSYVNNESINESMFRLDRYVSYRKSPLERQIGTNRFSESGNTTRTNVNGSKAILDLINVSIPKKYENIKNVIELVNNSCNVGWFNSNSISHKNDLIPESIAKHLYCFLRQKYYMIRQHRRARNRPRPDLWGFIDRYVYPERVMNCFNLDNTLDFPLFLDGGPPRYRVTNNFIWHDENQAKSTDSGLFYEFHLLDYSAALFPKAAKSSIWTNYLKRYGDLTVYGTTSSTMHKHSGEIDINFSRMGFDMLQGLTEKASSKSTAIANLKPIINLVINIAEEVFKYRLKLCLSHYRSLPIENPEGVLLEPYFVYEPFVPSFNFNMSMRDRESLRLSSFLSMYNRSGNSTIRRDGRLSFEMFPETPPNENPLYSKTFADWYIYKGVELNYIPIIYNMLKFTNKNLDSIISILGKLKNK